LEVRQHPAGREKDAGVFFAMAIDARKAKKQAGEIKSYMEAIASRTQPNTNMNMNMNMNMNIRARAVFNREID
jgi:hypothetical protein